MAEQNETPTFSCTVVTPTRTVAKIDKVIDALFMATDGEFEVQPRHEPALVPLQIGLLKITTLQDGGGTHTNSLVICGGFLDMDGENATVFAYSAERGDEVDVQRAKEAEKRARERLEKTVDSEAHRHTSENDLDCVRAERALARALARQQLTALRAV
ncbi:hypothetical protein FACS1894139_09270 [Planctomycetales bacterium]|nr:hypothetical protein FACS1894107_07330 [Planctomycetales bacterium]GHT05444.1 hypothetical protein FACS1894139_09270 [Planctomycetales bacterium]